MQFPRVGTAAALLAGLSALAAGQDPRPGDEPVQPSTPAKAADPMANFARLVGGEWRATYLSGKSMFHAWHWGPGRHSARRMTDGSGAGGEPWRGVQVYYWHPGHEQVRLLGVEPVAGGVAEGTVRFAGETARRCWRRPAGAV